MKFALGGTGLCLTALNHPVLRKVFGIPQRGIFQLSGIIEIQWDEA